MATVANLTTNEYAQYGGIMAAEYGLTTPKLSIEVSFGPTEPPAILRIGDPAPGGQYHATVDRDRSGPVFLLPSEFWSFWANGAKRPIELPENVFAP